MFSDDKIQMNISLIKQCVKLYNETYDKSSIQMNEFGQKRIETANDDKIAKGVNSFDDEIAKKVNSFLWKYYCVAFELVRNDTILQEMIREQKNVDVGLIMQFIEILRVVKINHCRPIA